MSNDERWDEIGKQAVQVERNLDMGIITLDEYWAKCQDISKQIYELISTETV